MASVVYVGSLCNINAVISCENSEIYMYMYVVEITINGFMHIYSMRGTDYRLSYHYVFSR